MKRIVIIGATSGIGHELVGLYLAKGWRVGIAGRRLEILEKMKEKSPGQIEYEAIDTTKEDAPAKLSSLIEKLGGMDLFLLSSGVGHQNPDLNMDIECNTLKTNVCGFTNLVVAAYKYFSAQAEGHIAVISSIAGTRGIGVAASYSSSKRFQSTYIDALAQLANASGRKISFTDIKPGFVETPILKAGKSYPMLMKVDYAAKVIVRALDKKKRRKIIDWRFAFFVFVWKLIPQAFWERLKVES